MKKEKFKKVVEWRPSIIYSHIFFLFLGLLLLTINFSYNDIIMIILSVIIVIFQVFFIFVRNKDEPIREVYWVKEEDMNDEIQSKKTK